MNRRRDNRKIKFTRSHMIKTRGGRLGKKLHEAHLHTFRNRDELTNSLTFGCRERAANSTIHWKSSLSSMTKHYL